MNTRAVCWAVLVYCASLAGCATRTLPAARGHINDPLPAAGSIPAPVQHSATLRPPVPAMKAETYSVTVHKVPLQSLLFALARDAGMNIDIHPGLDGVVTLNAIDQTLPQLLARIARQVDMRYEIDGKNLLVLPDEPIWRNYKVDYVNMARSTSSSVNIATQISTSGAGSNSAGLAANVSNNTSSNSYNNGNNSNSANNGNNVGNNFGTNSSNNPGNNNTSQNNPNASPPTTSNNNSTTSVSNRSDNNFWASLERNIRDMLREAPVPTSSNAPGAVAALPPGALPGQVAVSEPAPRQAAPREPPAVIVNVEAGLIAVRATGRQQEKVQAFLDLVLNSAKRQVLIEATILEVRLSDQYQQGINWQRLGGALDLTQGQVGSEKLSSGVTPGSTAGMFIASYLKGSLSGTVQLLESFGKVKVLSSPKISVLNNQTALLKVVDNNVFFTITVTPAVINSTGGVTTPATYESKLETVPVGFVMSVTPQISDSDEVTLNVRPTITRIVDYVSDPNPALKAANVTSQVPVIQARELESIMKVSNGQTAVMGGLMQDSVDNAKDGVPGLSGLPMVGNLFTYRNEKSSKTELVIFLRPVVVKDASVNGDFKDYRYLLPGQAPINSQPYFDTHPAPLVPPVGAGERDGS